MRYLNAEHVDQLIVNRIQSLRHAPEGSFIHQKLTREIKELEAKLRDMRDRTTQDRIEELKNRVHEIYRNIYATELLIQQATDEDTRERHAIVKRALVIKEYKLERLISKLEKSPQHKI